MLVQIKYILKNEPKTLRQIRKAEFFADDKEHGRAQFNDWVQSQFDVSLEDVLVMSVRDAGQDVINLDVKDTTIQSKGKI